MRQYTLQRNASIFGEGQDPPPPGFTCPHLFGVFFILRPDFLGLSLSSSANNDRNNSFSAGCATPSRHRASSARAHLGFPRCLYALARRAWPKNSSGIIRTSKVPKSLARFQSSKESVTSTELKKSFLSMELTTLFKTSASGSCAERSGLFIGSFPRGPNIISNGV